MFLIMDTRHEVSAGWSEIFVSLNVHFELKEVKLFVVVMWFSYLTDLSADRNGQPCPLSHLQL